MNVIDDNADVAVPLQLEMYVRYHLPGVGTTACGLPMSDMHHPLPGAWWVRRHWFGRPCDRCWPQPRDSWLWPIANDTYIRDCEGYR